MTTKEEKETVGVAGAFKGRVISGMSGGVATIAALLAENDNEDDDDNETSMRCSTVRSKFCKRWLPSLEMGGCEVSFALFSLVVSGF
jgi:hypothetical protein